MEKSFEQKAAAVLKSMEQDRQKLLTRQPFIGLILMSLELVPMPGDIVRTACTDGRRILMGIPFYAKLDQEERLFVMAHEAWHCVLLHGARRQARSPSRFNIAADLEIHFILQKEKMKEPFVLPHDPGWNGLSAEEIYEKLGPRSPKSRKGGGSPPDNGGFRASGKQSEHIQGKGNGEGFDEHVYAGHGNAPKPKDAPKEEISGLGGRPSDAEKGGISDTPAWDPQTVERMRRIVIQTAQVMERTQGHLPAHILGVVEALRKPELPWRELLRQFVTSCYGGSRRWLPPERRHVSRQLYLPSYRDNRMNAVMAIDTSGSTTWDLPQFFAELSSLLNSFGKYDLTVIQCDCAIQHVETFSDTRRFPRDYQWESFGHGGTSLVPPFDYVRDHPLRPDIFIYLTDGCGNAPEKSPRYPVLWVLTHDGEKPASWGHCIKLPGIREADSGFRPSP